MHAKLLSIYCLLSIVPFYASGATIDELVLERLALMRDVAAYKWVNKLPIEDLTREAVVFNDVTERSLVRGIEIESSARLFGELVGAAKEIQRYWFSVWKTHEAPVRAVDLKTQIRPRLTELGFEIFDSLVRREAVTRVHLSEQFSIDGLSEITTNKVVDAIFGIQFYRDNFDQIIHSGVLRVGTTGDYPPFSYRATADEQFRGVDIELARDLAHAFNAQIVFVQTSWPDLSRDLGTGKFDIAMSGVSRNLERQKIGFFSDPYHSGGKTPICRCENAERFSSLDKIDQDGIRVIVNPGGTNEQFIDSHLQRATKIIHTDNRSIFQALVDRKADVMITDSIEVDLQVSRNPMLCAAMKGTRLSFQEKGFLMQPDTRLKEFVNVWLATRIGDGSVMQAFTNHLK
ncbi:MAG: cyclohexadienyl dehydratase [Gammaproteobacteria bacterium]|jgi:cyclohexadienyl dehydratase